MGYKRPRKAYRLTFTEPEDMQGFEVTVNGLSSDEFLTLTGLASFAQGSAGEVTDAGRRMFGMLGEALAAWNLEDDGGVPVPPSATAVLALDFPFALRIVTAWLDAMAGVAPPLPRSSNGARSSQEASIPMETLSPSLSS